MAPRSSTGTARAEGWLQDSPGLRAPGLVELGVPHRFTLRGAGDALDLGTPDARERVEALRLGGGPPRAVVLLHQVHGADVLDADRFDLAGALERGEAPAADAAVTTRPDRLLCVRVADCVPVLLSSADGARVAAVHAGWRGVVAGVVPAALAHFPEPPRVAAIGPCLSLGRFEVGPEVASAFRDAGLGGCVHPGPPDRPADRARIDLRAAVRQQLERGGVERVDVHPACTWEDAAHLFSYRRDVTHGGRERTGRQAALVAVRP